MILTGSLPGAWFSPLEWAKLIAAREAKTVLAYSSVSQMGFIVVGIGVGMTEPQVWPSLAAGVMLYAAHHGLDKGALFLGVGMLPRDVAGCHLVLTALLLPALALAGAPLTSGALAKAALKAALPEGLALPLAVATIGTAALMVRFLRLMARREEAHGPDWHMTLAWLATLVAVLLGPSVLLPEIGSTAGVAYWTAAWLVLVWPSSLHSGRHRGRR